MANLTRYFNDEEELWIKGQPEGCLRILVQGAMGTEIRVPHKESSNEPVEISENKFEKRPPVPKIAGLSEGLKDLNKPRCKECKWPLDNSGKCSQKSCKKFMKPQ